MTGKTISLFSALLLLPAFVFAGDNSAQPDFRGTWSGTLFSKHSNVAPFTMTIVIGSNAQGHLVGNSTLSSDCLKGAHLQATVTASKIVLAGSDHEGDNITVRGVMDKSGTLLAVTYILNGSATGQCETDDGAGNLGRR